jgi:hypothetical protein
VVRDWPHPGSTNVGPELGFLLVESLKALGVNRSHRKNISSRPFFLADSIPKKNGALPARFRAIFWLYFSSLILETPEYIRNSINIYEFLDYRETRKRGIEQAKFSVCR